MADLEDFHIVARKEFSEQIAGMLRSAGIRIQERVTTEIGHPEYVIAVQLEDLERASEAFGRDLGPGRTFTSSAEQGAAADGGS